MKNKTATEVLMEEQTMNMGDFKKLLDRTFSLEAELLFLVKQLNDALAFLNNPMVVGGEIERQNEIDKRIKGYAKECVKDYTRGKGGD